MPIFNDNAESIGRTPLVRINRLAKGPGGRPFWPKSKAATRPTASSAASARR